MSYADLILRLLDKRQIEFKTIRAPETVRMNEQWLEKTVPLHSVARMSVLQDKNGLVLTIYPKDDLLSLRTLQTIMRRELHFIEQESISNQLLAKLHRPDYKADTKHGVQIIIDEQITNQDMVYFEAPSPLTLLEVKGVDLQNLSEDVLLGSVFSDQEPTQSKIIIPDQSIPTANLRERVAKLTRLPAMPDMPSKILALRNNPNGTVDQLVNLIESDLSLSSLILRYANSSIYHTQETITSLRDAIFRVLGYETVLHLSLGYSLGRVFKLPSKGPLGHEQFWKHSFYAGTLVQQFASAMQTRERPKPGIAYLAGLMHDVGFLALNLFFKNEHAWLNKVMVAQPNKSIMEIEARLLGMTHSQLGEWLLRSWNMPEEVLVAVGHHHNILYDGPHAEYALLVNLSERILKTHGMSDAESDEIPDELLERLGIPEDQVYEITDDVLSVGDTQSEMVTSLTA